MTLRRIIVPLVTASIITACDSSTNPQRASVGGSGDTLATAAIVNATPSIAFTPGNVKLAVGGTVTFDFGAVGHNVFFDNDPVGAPEAIDGVNANTSVRRTFPVAGVYTYYCHVHPGMSGTIVVGTDTRVQPDSSGTGGYYNPLP
jgi:plastocyanin